ncbi:MAG TPA: PKD domain-containing protein [Ohtaekwangia sp.]
MNISTTLKKNIWILGISLSSLSAMAQDVAMTPLTDGLSPDPLAAGVTNQAIFGVSFEKNDGGANTITVINIPCTGNPATFFTNYRLYRSNDDDDFEADDFIPANLVACTITPGTAPNRISITGSPITNFGGGGSANDFVTRRFFLVVDVLPGAPVGANQIQLSLATSDVTVNDPPVTGSAITGTNYDITALTTALAPLTGGVTAGPTLNNNLTNQALLGFSLTSTGNPNFTGITVTTTNPAAGKLTNIRLFRSTNNNTFDGGDASIATASSVTATTIVFTGLSQAFSPTVGYNYFIVADVDGAADDSTDPIQLLFDEGDVTLSSGPPAAATVTGIEYDFADGTPPAVTARTPAQGATGLTILLNTLQITFNEDIALLPGYDSDAAHQIRLKNVDGGTFIETIPAGNISITGNVATLTITPPLAADIDYAVYIGNSVFADLATVPNAFAGYNTDGGWTFETELLPNISGLSNSGIRCIKDQLIISGSRFTGTGGTGNTKPRVRINGTLVPDDSVKAFSSTSITLNIPPGASSGNVTVENMDNNLTSNGSALTVHAQISTTFSVVPSTLSPAQNTSVNFTVSPTQDNNHTYNLILTAKPAGHSVALGTVVDDDAGNNGPSTDLNTAANGGVNLTHIGTYSYRIDVTRTGCTTRSRAVPSITVASLAVTASATDTTICLGTATTLIGATSGGTGFYQFSWTSSPPGFVNSNSSPNVNPTVDTWYFLTLTDNSANVAEDSIFIDVNPVPVADIIPAPTESVIRKNYTIENRDYRLYGSPAGGEFSGKGVKLNNDNNYYFNPYEAGVGVWTIRYTFTNGFDCTDEDTEQFIVSNSAVTNLDLSYCRNIAMETGLAPNSTFPSSATLQFTRLVFYRQSRSTFSYCVAGPGDATFPSCGSLSNPLTVTSTTPVTDIHTLLTVNQPTSYSLNLDVIRDEYGYSTDNYFYILAYGKDQFGNESYRTFQYFDVLNDGPKPTVVGIEGMENICSDSDPITLSSSIPGYTITNFNIADTTAVPDIDYETSLSGAQDRIFNPGHAPLLGKDERLLNLTMMYSDFNNCPGSVVRYFNWVKKPNAPTDLDNPANRPIEEYCKVALAQSFTIDAAPNGSADNPNWYAQDPVTQPDRTTNPKLDSINFKGFVAPGINGLVATTRDFHITQTYKGCEGNVRIATITIKEAPNAAFIPPPICEDRDFTLSGPLESPNNSYDTYRWDFGNGEIIEVQDTNRVAYNYGPNTASTPFPIKLTVINSLNCQNESISSITVGNNPVPDFTFEEVCESAITKFSATTNIAVANYRWNFGDASTIFGPFTSPNTTHQFASAGDYEVTVRATTGQGCFGEDSTIVSILEYLTRTSDNPYEMSLEDGGRGFWKLQDFRDSTTWEFAAPNKTNIQSAAQAWVTNATGNYKANDLSVLNSPCFDITGIENPVLSLDFISNTDKDKDGTSLEFSLNDGVTWLPLGDALTGQNWFNTTFSSGDITKGWSGNMWDPGHQWLEGKHGLDIIPEAQRDKLRLRIAFSSNPDPDRYEGFAFANLAILPRNRFILVENFTNESDPQYAANNAAFKAIDPEEYVKLQYNLSFPGPDPINAENPVEPSARAAFYGITNDAQIFPRVFVDGSSKGNLTTNWFNLTSALRALKSSPLSMEITTFAGSPDQLTFSVSAKALRLIDAPFVTKPILHIAIVEKTVGDNEFVLRRMIPNTLGTEIPLPLADDDVFTVGPLTWNCSFDPDKVAIVAFVQDEVTREVYQASILTESIHMPTVITGIESSFSEEINIFPNPAQGEFQVELPQRTKEAMPFSLIDGFGREVYNNTFTIGEQFKTVNTSDLKGGVYILQIKSAAGEVARKKVIITNR